MATNMSSFEKALNNILTSMGSTPALDTWMLYPYFVLSLIATLCNIFNLIVFNHSSFNTPLYKYLRVYCFTNIVYCVFGMARAFTASYRIIWWANSKPVRYFYVYAYIPVSNIAYFFNSLIDILILIDRISFFSKRAQSWFKWLKISPYRTCSIALLACIIIYSPMLAIPEPAYLTLSIANQTAIIWFNKNSAFGNSQAGIVLKAIVLILKDGLTTILQVTLNLVSLYLLKRFLKKKRTIVSTATQVSTTANSLHNQSKRDSHVETQSQQSTVRKELNAEQMASLMSISLVFLSVLEHSMYIVSNVYAYFPFNLTTFIFFYYNSFFGSVKRILDLVTYCIFNKQFRSASLKILRLKS